jgi:hypothetical protein
MKMKIQLPESVGHAKAMLRGKFIAISAYIKKKKKNRDFSVHHYNLMMNCKLQNKNKLNPKPADGEK